MNSPTLLALRATFMKLGTILGFFFKIWKWGITVLLIVMILIQNTATGAQTGKYWEAYRDGIIKDIVAADKRITDEISVLKEKDWKIEGLTESKFNNLWVLITTYFFIFESLWFIAMFGYLIWLILSRSPIAPWSYQNGPATVWTIITMALLNIAFSLYYLKLQGPAEVSVFLMHLIPFQGIILNLIPNLGHIVQTLVI